ncbi:DUF4139 domain-containing protein [Halomonas huangheensis]|uniref:DUF4139 domain-containing protein n=1 Tax=Halomonas huangheensis TaxID=1178482 RepID=W1N426_9GAMM|nr:DUF4139 domain-containing protein [Halomonas huangheensis]ALM51287.1 hypothetical protein AR456_02500 [Halomonas huangheensis]ERL49715.1 hypothetical protein BJB45_00945 [Halomonas huangheensis]
MAVILPSSLLSPAWATESPIDSHIDSITLSRGGLAEIHRSAPVDANRELHLEIPLEQVDDILKSLVVQDPQGSVESMTLDGLAPVEETFRRLPFSPDQLTSLPALLATLQGIQVRASSGGRSLEGSVLGVSEQAMTVDDGGNVVSEPILSLMNTDGQMEVMRLGSDSVVEILDQSMRERVAEAARVSGRGRSDELRDIAIRLGGTGERNVSLSYVVSAPVWKSAYRLVIDEQDSKARLQAWAVVENTSGEDWNNVSLTLSSGAPVTLTQRLHQRYRHQREEIPVMVGASEAPRPDNASQMSVDNHQFQAQRLSKGMAADMALAESAPAPMSMASAGQNTETDESLTQASYRLPQPIDLAADRTLAVPFVDSEVPAQWLSLFQPDSGSSHPVAAIRLSNDTDVSLPAGILTVYGQDDGYIGDAQLTGLPNGESRMVSFAADRKVEISSEAQTEDESRIAIVDDTLHATRTERQTTTYTIKGAADAPRTIVIEHPRQPGWDFTSPQLDTTTPNYYRLKLDIEAGAEDEATAVMERSNVEVIALTDIDSGSLYAWSGSAVDADTGSHLTRLAELKRLASQAQQTLDQTRSQIQQAESGQARVRDNLAAVPADSELGQRYLSMLEEQEDQIAQLNDDQQRALATLRERQTAVEDFIRQLSGRSTRGKL